MARVDHHHRDIDHIDAGIYTLRVTITASPFNLNWFEFEFEGRWSTLQATNTPSSCRGCDVPQSGGRPGQRGLRLDLPSGFDHGRLQQPSQLVYGEHFEDTSEFKPPLPWKDGPQASTNLCYPRGRHGTSGASSRADLPTKVTTTKKGNGPTSIPFVVLAVLSRKSCAWSVSFSWGCAVVHGDGEAIRRRWTCSRTPRR